jgi:hypothetical protein
MLLCAKFNFCVTCFVKLILVVAMVLMLITRVNFSSGVETNFPFFELRNSFFWKAAK